MAGGQRRARRPRSTRGCHTCRVRHLKCDEGFPCQRCSSAGWQCDGPRSNGSRGNLVFQHERPDTIRRFGAKPQRFLSPFVWLTDDQERRAFDFYIRKAGPLLSSVLDAKLWSDLVPRLAETDATIRYSMLAISHLCEYPIRNEEGGSIRIHPLDRRHVPSLRWQARALSLEKQQQSQVDTSMLILKCLLLSCQEFQQNNFRNGWKLARTAFTLVSPLMTRGCENLVSNNVMSNEIVKTIVPIMMRNACLLFSSWDTTAEYFTKTTNLDEIGASVFHYLCMVFASIKDVHVTNKVHTLEPDDKIAVRVEQLHSVLQTLQAVLDTIWFSHLQQQPLKCRALHEYCSIGINWLETLRWLIDQSPTEEDFLQAVLCETRKIKSIASVKYPTAASTMYFDSFVISPPAYFLTIFTNSSQMRSEALAMLREDLHHDSKADLIAIVETAAGYGERMNENINTNSVYQIYYGSKDREHLLHDTYDESTDSTSV